MTAFAAWFGARSAFGLLRGQRDNTQRVNRALELVSKRFVNQALARQPALALKGLRHDAHAEMALASGPRSRMAGVSGRLIFNFKGKRR